MMVDKQTGVRIFLRVASFVVIGLLLSITASAQTDDRNWQEPIDLAARTAFTSLAMTPKIAADLEGNVHVVWGAWLGPNPAPNNAPNVVFYTFWDGEAWSEPVDVLASEEGHTLGVYNISTTRSGEVIILWGSDGILFLSRTAIGEATNPRNWRTVALDFAPSILSADLAIDSGEEYFYVAYVYQVSKIVFLYSRDSGGTWEAPLDLWEPSTVDSAPSFVDVVTAGDGSANVFWSENTAARSWSPVAIWHSRVTFENGDPSVVTRQVARSGPDGPTMGWPSAISGAGEEIHLFWNNGIGSATGRFHQWSLDDGVTWSSIESVFAEDLSGQTGQAGLALDSLGRLHLVTSSASSRTRTDLVLRYAVWDKGAWSSYADLWPTVASEHPSLAVTDGNKLHIVWRDESHNAIAYSSYEMEIPSNPDQSFAGGESSERTESEASAEEMATPSVSIEVQSTQLSGYNADLSLTTRLVWPVWWGVVPVLFVTVGFIFYYLHVRPRRL